MLLPLLPFATLLLFPRLHLFRRHHAHVFEDLVPGLADPNARHEEVDIRTYAKYILKSGTMEEKRELMGCFKSKFKIAEGVVTVD